MPGEKRMIDEDTWLARQSKKFKCGRVLSNVYDSTLAKLRIGARSFFQSLILTENMITNEETSESPITNGIQSDFYPRNIPAVSSSTSHICERCSVERNSTIVITTSDVCSYCDKKICHLNTCSRCNCGFCNACSLQKYDNEDPMSESFICIGCLGSV